MNGIAAVERFYAILTLVGGVSLVGAIGAAVSPRLRRRLQDVSSTRGILGLAWIVAALATLGSLFFSEVAHFAPCRLCWYQRIAMYPLVIVLGIAALRDDPGIWRYAVPPALIGLGIAIYHYAVEWLPSLDAGACDLANPCSLVWFREFGFVSLPLMAATAFALIVGLLVLARWSERGRHNTATGKQVAR